MAPDDLDARARAAYEAYALKTGGRSMAGENLASWPDLPERIKEAWRDAAIAAVRWTAPRDRKATPPPAEGTGGRVTRLDEGAEGFDTSDIAPGKGRHEDR